MAEDNARINLRYVTNQLVKATGERFKQWQRVLGGLVDGTLRIGSRTPVDEAPAWVTLEVLHGGFATGAFAAAGPLREHEQSALATLRERSDAPERTTLNLHFLAGPGRRELDRMLEDGSFRVEVPEEAALLCAAWLHRRGEAERSASLIAALAPFFDRLRFYPVPHAEPLSGGAGVHLECAGEVVARLQAKRPSLEVERMREAITIWTPLYDHAVALFLETVEGAPPTLQRTAAGAPARGPTGDPLVIGGWPCRHFPADWPARARALLDEYGRLREKHTLCRKPDKPKENFARLRKCLEICLTDPALLKPRDVGAIRRILGTFIGSHGAPDSVRRLAARSAQTHATSMPAHHLVAHRVAERLRVYPPYAGVPELDAVLAPLTAAGALPPAISAKALRCLEAPFAELVRRNVIGSSETLARVLPVVTARARSAAIEDLALRRVFEAAYVAFRRRRSLLLLQLEGQVQFGELPWIEALSPWVGSDQDSRAAARATLIEVSNVVFTAFPHALLPNPLLRELRAIAATAGLSLPLVDELAADIFAGAFDENYLRAAQRSASMLRETLYGRYYDLPYAALEQLNDVEVAGSGPAASPGFLALCRERARRVAPNVDGTALHGMILEQAQILTTHNLAVLFSELDLASTLDVPAMARATFDQLGRQLQRPLKDWRTQLHVLKNTASAWRQLIFYLSLLPRAELDAVLVSLDESAARRKPLFRERFAAVLAGLRAVAAGDAFDPDGLHASSGGRRFLGWTAGTHWLLRRPAGPRARR